MLEHMFWDIRFPIPAESARRIRPRPLKDQSGPESDGLFFSKKKTIPSSNSDIMIVCGTDRLASGIDGFDPEGFLWLGDVLKFRFFGQH